MAAGHYKVVMRVKLKAAVSGEGLCAPDYPIRARSFVFSVATHALIVGWLLTVRFPLTAPTETPVQEAFFRPNEHKILLYDFRRRVPDVNPVRKLGRAKQPQGAELSRQTIIASSPKPKSTQVLISVPVPKLQIPQDIPAPLMVLQMAAVAPPPPPPEPPKPKQFVPPKPSQQTPKLPMQTPVLDATQAPSLSSPLASSAPPVPRIALTQVAVPQPKAPEAPTPKTGDAKAELAVASLHPAESLDTPVPNGERQARFSKAPAQGEPASGEPNGRVALAVPDLTVRNPLPETAPKIAVEEILYAERVRGVPVSTLSVPLRPSSRMIPAAVDAQFKGRNVYTIVIPMERIPEYTGDWILWFADRGSKAGETPVMRAPVPLRKLAAVDQTPANLRTRERIQFSAILGKNGRLDRITILTRTTTAVQHAVFQDVTAWEFQPATSDGVAVDVDVMVEIPFSLPPALASNSSQ
jgi:hypothetical protein